MTTPLADLGKSMKNEMSNTEIDAAVAERIMGWSYLNADETSAAAAGVKRPIYNSWITPDKALCSIGAFTPSTDIGLAWAVVLKMRSMMFGYTLTSSGHEHYAAFGRCLSGKRPDAGDCTDPSVTRAICLAALAAVGAQ